MRAPVVAAGLVFLAGCGGSNVAPVSGTVTLNQKPLAHATVVFQPTGGGDPGPGSTGTTDATGRYELKVMTTGAPGARVGKHTVAITAYAGEGDEQSSAPPAPGKEFRKALVPEEYNAKTKLTFDVPAGGTAAANFDLIAK
jgi:hypothetical protein